jgi:hypothetical protein
MTRRRSLLLASLACLAVLGGCDGAGGSSSSSTAPHPSEGSARHIQEIQAVAHASGQPAQSYGVDRPHTPSEVEQAILSLVDDRYRGDLTHDPALSAMVHDLALASPSRFDMPPTLLDALLAWHGIPDPEPAVVVVELQGSEHGCDRAPKPECEDALDALVDEVLATLDSVSGKPRWRYGVGVAAVEDGARTRMMVALVERAIELEPIPVSLPANGKLDLHRAGRPRWGLGTAAGRRRR